MRRATRSDGDGDGDGIGWTTFLLGGDVKRSRRGPADDGFWGGCAVLDSVEAGLGQKMPWRANTRRGNEERRTQSRAESREVEKERERERDRVEETDSGPRSATATAKTSALLFRALAVTIDEYVCVCILGYLLLKALINHMKAERSLRRRKTRSESPVCSEV